MTHSWHKRMYPIGKESWYGSATRKVFAAFFTDRWKMTPILTIALAPLAAWRRDPMVWGLVYTLLIELTAAAALMCTSHALLPAVVSSLFITAAYQDIPSALAALGLLVLICSCWEYQRTGAWGH